MTENVDATTGKSSFEQAGENARAGVITEFWGFLKHNKKWWLLPILLAFVIIGALLVIGGSAAGPLIYTLF